MAWYPLKSVAPFAGVSALFLVRVEVGDYTDEIDTVEDGGDVGQVLPDMPGVGLANGLTLAVPLKMLAGRRACVVVG